MDEEGQDNARREVELMNLEALKQRGPTTIHDYKMVEDFLYKCIGHDVASIVDIAQECNTGYCLQNAGRQRYTLLVMDQCVDSLDVVQQRDGGRVEVKTGLEKKKRKWFKKYADLSDELKAWTWSWWRKNWLEANLSL